MDWVSIIVALIGALTGGGLLSLFTVREYKKGMKLDNAEKEDNRWSKLADELQDQNEKLNERIDVKDSMIQEKEDTISDLRTKLDSVRTKCAIAEILRCETVSCPSRVPPLGVRNMNVEKMVEADE